MNDFMSNAMRELQADNTRSAAVTAERNEIEISADDDFCMAVDCYYDTRARLDVAGLMHAFTWQESDDLDEGETALGRLLGSLCASADRDDDGVLTDEESMVFKKYQDAADDFLEDLGVTDEDRQSLLLHADEGTGARVQALLQAKLPSEIKDFEEILIGFAFAPMLPESVLPESTLDAVTPRPPRRGYTWARRFRGRTTLNHWHGKRNQVKHKMKHKTWAKHSSKQRAALIKARLHAHTEAAKVFNKLSNKKTREANGRRVV